MKKSGLLYRVFRITSVIVYLTLFEISIHTGSTMFIALAATLVALDLAVWFF